MSASLTTPQHETIQLLAKAGTSVWLDDLSRAALDSGELSDLAERGLIAGVTTNPTIFHQAITGSDGYAAQLAALARLDVPPDAALRQLTCTDVRRAADVLRPLHGTEGNGMVSIEVSPHLAHDATRTLDEVRLLQWLVDRPNVMIKIPATDAGLAAVTEALAEGISVNVTLIFGLRRYRQVMEAHLAGLERAAAAGRDLASVASVASFFVSRVDAAVDARLPIGHPLRGQAALANARLAYELYEQTLDSARWRALARRGALPQRPLWASTGVKDPAYEDTRYVTGLVAPDTVNTMPRATLDAVLDHGEVHGDTVRTGYDEARDVLRALAADGIDLAAVAGELETDGVARFQDSWQQLTRDIRVALSTTAPTGERPRSV
ncbi:transaldolase [Streptomyces sp. NPDC056296]|uniref:transaldolase n=1 Tax=Streptomyces sp. NPDC056296 TaxID=3345775 RepID=UPI0035DBADE0